SGAYHAVPGKDKPAMEPDSIPAEAVAAAPVPATVPELVAEGLVLGNPEALAAQLESFSKARTLFVAWLFDRLVSGTDYMLIHRKVGPRGSKTDCPNRGDAKGSACETCGGKATLCKPGSEKICGLLQLRPRFKRDVDAWEMLGGEAGLVTLVCELVTPAGVVVAEGRGARHRDQDFGDVNKCLKMAQKSAQTDAVLRCRGAPDVLTAARGGHAALPPRAPPAPGAPLRGAQAPEPPDSPRGSRAGRSPRAAPPLGRRGRRPQGRRAATSR